MRLAPRPKRDKIHPSSGWVPIEYGDFWDVPRLFSVSLDSCTVVFDGPFDTALDRYSPEYRVYRLPKDAVPSWVGWDAAKSGLQVLGTVRVSGIRFDSSRRRYLWSADILSVLDAHEADLSALVRKYRDEAPSADSPPPPSPYS